MVRTLLPFILLVLLLVPSPAEANTVDVVKVHSGDLIEVGDGFMLRLVGLKAPSLDDPNGQKAYTYLKDAIEGRKVKLFTWTTDNTAAGIVHDDDGNAFGEIWYGENYSIELNAEMLKLGLVITDPIHMPENKADHYLKCEETARKNHQGLWAEVK